MANVLNIPSRSHCDTREHANFSFNDITATTVSCPECGANVEEDEDGTICCSACGYVATGGK